MNTKYDSLSGAVEACLDKFFDMHDGDNPESGLYDRIINEVEKILIVKTLAYSNNVQVQAAKILGINRNTLRKKMKEFKID